MILCKDHVPDGVYIGKEAPIECCAEKLCTETGSCYWRRFHELRADQFRSKSSTSFPASAASHSDLSAPASAPLPSVNSGPTVEQFSLDIGLASPSSPTSNSSPPALWPTPHGMCVPNKRRAGPSGNELGRAVNESMSSAEDFPARTSRSPAKALELRERGAACGVSSTDSFASYGPLGWSLKTSQLSLLEESTSYSGTWPRSGMTRSGTAFLLPTLARRTGETESGLLPTPAGMGGGGSSRGGDRKDETHTLQGMARKGMLLPTPTATTYGSNQGGAAGRTGPVRHSLQSMAARGMWTTPQAHDARGGSAKRVGRFGTKHGGRNLVDDVMVWPTPRAHDGPKMAANLHARTPERVANGRATLSESVQFWPTPTVGDSKASGSRNTEESQAHPGISLTDAVRGDGGTGRPSSTGGSLNPTWVEWLMGFPLSWTALEVYPSNPRRARKAAKPPPAESTGSKRSATRSSRKSSK